MGKDVLIYYGVSAVIGAITGFGLSYTALSPLVVGGIVGSIIPALFTTFFIGGLLYQFCKGNEIEDDHRNATIGFGIITALSAAAGVGIIVAANAIFPGVTTMGSPALVGAIIGATALTVGTFAAFVACAGICAACLAAFMVNECIVEPVVEKVKGCFSSI